MFRIICIPSWLLLVVMAGTSFSSARLLAQAEGESKFGPQTRGLSLQLMTKHKGGGDSENLITVKLVNRGDKSVTLMTRFDYEEGDTFEQFFEQSLYFSAYPEVMPTSFSTAGTHRLKPQAKRVLKPGDSVTVRRRCKKGSIPGGSLSHTNLYLVKSGKYFVRAHVRLNDEQGKPFDLWSNESPFTSGNSNTHPDASVATIVRYERDGDDPLAILDIGRLSGVRVGDEFEYSSKTSGYRFSVTAVSSDQCKATVQTALRTGRDTSQPPPRQTRIAFSKRPQKPGQE